MMQARCSKCRLPVRIHFAWRQESGIKGLMSPQALRPGAIVCEPRELRIVSLSEWLARRAAGK